MNDLITTLEKLHVEFDQEAKDIAFWWSENLIDKSRNRFYGLIDSRLIADPSSSQSLVYNSRILWFFSEMAMAATDVSSERKFLSVAEIAFETLSSEFQDTVDGGMFWEVNHLGQPIDQAKRVYGQAFCLYGLVSYFKASQSAAAEALARGLFDVIQQKCLDKTFGGYFESFSRDWQPLEDQRLSSSDRNFPKSMNTNLHVMEALTSFHQVMGTHDSNVALRNCIETFRKHLLTSELRLKLFSDIKWADRSGGKFSQGHEIEFTWLLCTAATAAGDEDLISWAKSIAVKMTDRILGNGVRENGLLPEEERGDKSIWWIQAEAILGFLNAFEISDRPEFLKAAEAVWDFAKCYHRSSERGLWTWYSVRDQAKQKYVAGPWKGPYHDGRAMLEGRQRAFRMLGRARKKNEALDGAHTSCLNIQPAR